MIASEDDVFARIEACFVELSGLLERGRRYRPLAASFADLVRASSRLSSDVRAALRTGDEAKGRALEDTANGLVAGAREGLERVLGSADYVALGAAVTGGDDARVATLVPALFADVEPADAVATIYQPLTAKRGEGAIEPEAGAQRLAELAKDGVGATPGPGVGGDESIHPIRFYEGTEGLDVAVLLEIDGAAIARPLFRASGLGEVLVYAPRLVVPFRVAVRLESPDDWLEARPGGYERYRARWLEALALAGLTTVDVS